TTTSCPAAARARLTHGEWVPASTTTRALGSFANRSENAAAVEATVDRSRTSPSFASSTQTDEVSSPRSMPTIRVGVTAVDFLIAGPPLLSHELANNHWGARKGYPAGGACLSYHVSRVGRVPRKRRKPIEAIGS